MKYYETLVFNTYGEVPESRGVSREGRFRGYYGIQYNHAGTLFLSLDGAPAQVVSGPHAFLSHPGPFFRYGAPEGRTRHHCYVCFSGTLVKRFLAGGLLDLKRRSPLIKVVNSERFHASFRGLVDILRRSGGTAQPRAAWMLEDLLLQLQEQPGKGPAVSPYCRQGLQRLRDAIAAEPLRQWDFPAEAARLAISHPHFRRLFRALFGLAPRQFLIETRLDLATRLLEDSVMPIAEVAHRSGFPDEFYFSRIFRKHRLIAPSALRGHRQRP